MTTLAVPRRAAERRTIRLPGGRYLVVGPPFLFLVILYVAPAAMLVALSLWKIGDDYRIRASWDLGQYRQIFTDPVALRMLRRTFLVAVENTAITLLVSFPLAYFLARVVSPRWRNLLLVLLIAPSWTSYLIRIYSWVLVLGNGGLVNYVAKQAHAPGAPYRFLIFDQFSLLVSLVYLYLPFMVLPIYASLEKIEPAQLEAACSLGARPWRVLLRVTLPLSRAGILAGCMMTFIPTLGEYVAPAILGGHSGYLYGNYISDQFAIFDWPAGAALGVVLLVATLVLVAVCSRFIRLREVWGA